MLKIVIKRWKENTPDKQAENFRKGNLWTYQVELVFTMNEAPLKQIHSMLCHKESDSRIKPYGFDAITPEDCDWFFREKCNLNLTSK